jgi:hypothetical protein
MKPYIADFLKFLESKENKKVPLIAKLLNPDKFGSLTKEELNVKGFLGLTGTRIRTIPDNLIVDGSLYLQGTKIESLPNNLKVGGSLYLWDTPLAERMTKEEIRQEIERKGGYIKGVVLK